MDSVNLFGKITPISPSSNGKLDRLSKFGTYTSSFHVTSEFSKNKALAPTPDTQHQTLWGDDKKSIF